VDWLSKRPLSTTVATIDQVVGGKMKPSVGLVQDYGFINVPHKVPDSAQAAFTVGEIRVNQTLVMLLGIVIALTFVITYRIATKGDRYARRHQ